MQATFRPQTHLREVAIERPAQAALLFIDVQNYNCHPSGAEFSGNPYVSSPTETQPRAALTRALLE